MKKACLIILFFVIALSGKSQLLPAPFNLRSDFLLHTDKVSRNGMPENESLTSAVNNKSTYQFPIIYSSQPVFNWEVDTSIKEITAWRILVASSSQLLDKNKADYWDSKKILSPHSRAVYDGKILGRGKIYYWKICFWNEKDQESIFSKTSSFFLTDHELTDSLSHYPLTAEMQKPSSIIKKNDGSYFLDFGKDAFGQLHLHVTSNKDDSIWIEAGEALEGKNSILKNSGNIRYTRQSLFVKKGAHDYIVIWPPNEKRNHRNSPILMPDYIGEVFPFRYVSIENFPGIIDESSVQRKMVNYPFDDKASEFITDDTVLNKVWDLCKYSEKATSFSGYYVDGDRERVPYEADALINQLSHYSVDPDYSMARRSMSYVLYFPTWPTEWSLQNVLLAWNDYMYTGDDCFLKKYYYELQKKILMPLAGSNGLISTKTGKQTSDFLESIHFPKGFDDKQMLRDNVDWPHSSKYAGNEKEYDGETDGFVYNDYNSVVNAFYYRALVLMKKIATVLDKKEDALFYNEKAKQVYQSFQQVFRDNKTGLIKDGDSTDHSSLHANMFALVFGLVPEADKEKVTGFIKTRKMACSVYGAQFLLEALYDNDEGNYALSLLDATTQRSWYNMIRSGSTITMEAWDKVYKPNLDWNHAWGAAPANIIVRKLMGIEPITPGFETFKIKPQLGKLTSINLKTPTIKGEIVVSYKKNKNNDVMDVIIPGGTSAIIYLPFDPAKKNLFMDGRQIGQQPDNGFICIKNVIAGQHRFILK